jgi:hypothetical protein
MDYQSTYRRSEVAIPALLAVVAIFGAATVAMVKYVDGRHVETAVFSLDPDSRMNPDSRILYGS